MSRALLILNSDEARETAIRWIKAAPEETRVEFKRKKRSIPQNDRLWAMLSVVAAEATHKGQKYPAEIWKVLFMSALGREVQFIPALEGHGVIPIGHRSSDLSVQEMTELMDYIEAWAAQRSIDTRPARERSIAA